MLRMRMTPKLTVVELSKVCNVCKQSPDLGCEWENCVYCGEPACPGCRFSDKSACDNCFYSYDCGYWEDGI